MKLLKRALLVLCAAAMLLSGVTLTASADDANVTYTGNSGNMIFEPGSEHSPTDLFPNFKNVMPGASLTQRITVKNKADDKVKVKIYLRSLGSTDEKYNEFLNQLRLTVTKVGESPMFDAQADQSAGLTEWVLLGTLYAGGEVDLLVTLDVPTTLDNMFQKKIGMLRWQFVTEQFPLELPKWECPNDKNHSYHIEEKDGKSVFVCDDCEKEENMKCKECDSDMREVRVIEIGGETYIVHRDGERHYVTEDGKVEFFLNEDDIIDYYLLNGKRIDVRDIHEYVMYLYYECLKNKEHHTDPNIPDTGDSSHTLLWLTLAVGSTFLLLIVLLGRRKRKDDEEVRVPCQEEKL